MKRIWSLAAAVCAVAAFVFFWFQNFDGVFVTAVLGSVAWLLSYRSDARQRVFTENTEDSSD
ncbi:MAG: hypothetical protein ABI954_04780 [Pyrinomonadaceae bacterium]